jgi:hypothetical protein
MISLSDLTRLLVLVLAVNSPFRTRCSPEPVNNRTGRKTTESTYQTKLIPTLTTSVASDSSTSTRCERQLPSAIIIGVKKSGTYALLRYLSINGQVRPALKINNCNLNEIHFFDHDANYKLGVEWYRQQMPLVCQHATSVKQPIVIEKTPGYFRSESAIDRLHKFNPSMKLVLIVRHPVRRLRSELTHCDTRQKRFNLERKCAQVNTYFERLFANGSLSEAQVDAELDKNKFIRNSVYYLDLAKWLGKFDLSRVFVLDGEAFIKEPWTDLARLERFLNATPRINKSHFYFDADKNFYCLNENRSSDSLEDKMPVVYKREFDGCLGKNKGRKSHVFLSESVVKRLEVYFAKWNSLFYDLIGQKFNW